jgi:hypothetical protein
MLSRLDYRTVRTEYDFPVDGIVACFELHLCQRFRGANAVAGPIGMSSPFTQGQGLLGNRFAVRAWRGSMKCHPQRDRYHDRSAENFGCRGWP